jgi:hypothetical protein
MLTILRISNKSQVPHLGEAGIVGSDPQVQEGLLGEQPDEMRFKLVKLGWVGQHYSQSAVSNVRTLWCMVHNLIYNLHTGYIMKPPPGLLWDCICNSPSLL